VLAFKRVLRAVPMVGALAEHPRSEAKAKSKDINLWADSVGDAFGQLGLVLTLAIASRLAIHVLSDLATALR
jgi:hypothetical protein